MSEEECARTGKSLEQDDIEGPGQQLADLVDSGSGGVGEAHCQVVPGTSAQQEADGRAHRCAHRYAAGGQVREAQQLRSATQQHASENRALAAFPLLCCVLWSADGSSADLAAFVRAGWCFLVRML